ncbi:MAG: LysR family transcriptional regulator [Polyangiaceae bacterium]
MESSDLSALATLDALLQEVSVSGAARRLGLSTPAVSHALARLRERFADPLLVRAGRTMVLTPRAESLKPRVRDAVASASRVFEPTEEFHPERLERSFTLSMTDYVMVVFGGAFEERLRDAAPGLDLRVVPNAVDDGERLREGDSDLAVGIYGHLPPELRSRPIITDRLICVVREGHPSVKQRLTLERFVELPHIQIAPRGRPGGYVDNLLELRGLRRRVARAVPYFQVALELAASSDYLLVVSERIAKQLGPRLGLRLLEPPLPFEPYTLSLVWHPRYDGDAAHQWLRSQLLESVQALAGAVDRDARRSESTKKRKSKRSS